jgi:hypothetical protein
LSARRKTGSDFLPPVATSSAPVRPVRGTMFLADSDRQIRLHGDEHRFVGTRRRRRGRCRKLDADIDGGERCCDHEDDEKNQHHVDERRDIDLVCFGQIVTCADISTQTCAHDLLRGARDAQ